MNTATATYSQFRRTATVRRRRAALASDTQDWPLDKHPLSMASRAAAKVTFFDRVKRKIALIY